MNFLKSLVVAALAASFCASDAFAEQPAAAHPAELGLAPAYVSS